jgi:hypothetical protein
MLRGVDGMAGLRNAGLCSDYHAGICDFLHEDVDEGEDVVIVSQTWTRCDFVLRRRDACAATDHSIEMIKVDINFK